MLPPVNLFTCVWCTLYHSIFWLNIFLAIADFNPQAMTVTLSLSQPRDCIQVDIVNDIIADPNEVFEVVLTTNTVNTIVLDGADTATVNITNNISKYNGNYVVEYSL